MSCVGSRPWRESVRAVSPGPAIHGRARSPAEAVLRRVAARRPASAPRPFRTRVRVPPPPTNEKGPALGPFPICWWGGVPLIGATGCINAEIFRAGGNKVAPRVAPTYPVQFQNPSRRGQRCRPFELLKQPLILASVSVRDS